MKENQLVLVGSFGNPRGLKGDIIINIFMSNLKSFKMLKEFFLEREILICREITKIHETFYRGKVSEIDNFQFNPKGEVTVIISEKNNRKSLETLNESDKKKIRKLILNKTIKDIVGIISEEKNISKSIIYNYCLQIKNEK